MPDRKHPEQYWTHALCDTCWETHFKGRAGYINGDSVRVKDCSETCCQCLTPTTSGIFVRVEPKVMPCFTRFPEGAVHA